MKNKFLIFFLVGVYSISVLAQNDPKAENLANDVLEKVRSYDNISINFSYTLENIAEQLKEETRGEVYVEGNKYRLNLMGTTQIFDGSKLYTIIPADEEINISSVNSQDDNTITPSKMLTFFEDGYVYKWDIEQNQSGRKIQYIKLIPIDSNADYKNILLGVDKHTKNISNLIYTMNNGTRTEIKISSFKPNEPLSENTFKFDKSKYPDYYINELD
ncbi:LolA family protein [Mesohalobacter halotolerans]|uniref:Outer membrane lipoprotein carrier protein LolA n=1 Tax=Mesohalobacter halotolerans TaxID=1883405 RepID=A0A4U5TQ65_9FLAO|nr:outer membrane lipoprotein carrier protein LolA [Mesohalobacter halotolerans]MBS3738232.1 outer membrane lipoprotein carrier protein LolA [Psychroflexus sp.]TKS56319.1 outer membrane lipoprotein carrier protein LolA [Mesohalobacter halotolerans]